ncbi:MAG: DUF2723 domain-containing protein [Anaerolineae bacterium]
MKRISFFSTILTPIAVFIATLALYISTLAPGMLSGDSGEFQWAMASLNVAHATGYPLYTLLGHAWLQLPLQGAPAWRLNLLSALFGAGAVTALYIFARALTHRLDAALAAALFLALAPVFWFNASILEVYTLNALFLILVLYLVWRWGYDLIPNPSPEKGGEVEGRGGPGVRSDRFLYLAFFIIGLALAHHRMTILIAPGLVVYFLLVERTFFFNWRRLLFLALTVLPGLALYLYVPIRLLAAGANLHYAIFDIVLGQEFAASLRLYPDPLHVLAGVPAENFHIGLLLAAVGVVALWRRARNLNVLLILVLLADVAFALFYSVPDVEVFLTPSFVVIALWIAVGITWLVELLARRLAPRATRLATVAGILAMLLSFLSLLQYDAVRAQVRAEAGGKEARARAIFAANLPRGAILELDWETATAVRFLQAVEGTRPDLEARLIKVNEHDEYFWVLKNVDAGRPVYVESGVKWIRAAAGYHVRSAPVDLAQLVRETPEIQTVKGTISDRVQLDGLQNNPQSLTLYWKLRQSLGKDLATFVHYFDDTGQPLGQEDHGACCEAVYGYRTSEWDSVHEMADVFRPAPANTAYMQIGMYALNGDDLAPYGQDVYLQVKPVIVPANVHPLGAVFGGRIRASAYELKRDGNNYQVTFYWQSTAASGQDLKVFVHLLDASGKIVAQADHPPFSGVYPTSAWQPGQNIPDPFLIPAQADGVKLEFGLYDTTNGKRLQTESGDAVTIDIK